MLLKVFPLNSRSHKQSNNLYLINMIKFEKTNLDKVILITLDPFEDFRGQYVETYNEELYRKNGIDNQSQK